MRPRECEFNAILKQKKEKGKLELCCFTVHVVVTLVVVVRTLSETACQVAELQTKAFLSALSAIESYEHCKTNLGQA